MAAISEINADLKRASRWGKKWKTTFEPTKTHAMLVSNTKDAAYHPMVDLLEFDGVKIGFEKELKIVGVIYDNKLNWSAMASYVAAKGRQALGFLKRLGGLVRGDLDTIYKYFVRSRMEYGDTAYIGAATSHLDQLDNVQRRAERLCNKKFDALGLRREADCFGLLCKVLDGRCLEPVQDSFRSLKVEVDCRSMLVHTDRIDIPVEHKQVNKIQITNINNTLRTHSLETFKRSFISRSHFIFDRLPDELKQLGLDKGWMSIMKRGQDYILNNYSTPEKPKKWRKHKD